jgi:hypothetical protein
LIMSRSAWIETGHNGLERVFSICFGKLMTSTPEPRKVILSVSIRVPEIEDSSPDGLAFTVKHETGQAHRNACDTRLPEIVLER